MCVSLSSCKKKIYSRIRLWVSFQYVSESHLKKWSNISSMRKLNSFSYNRRWNWVHLHSFSLNCWKTHPEGWKHETDPHASPSHLRSGPSVAQDHSPAGTCAAFSWWNDGGGSQFWASEPGARSVTPVCVCVCGETAIRHPSLGQTPKHTRMHVHTQKRWPREACLSKACVVW